MSKIIFSSLLLGLCLGHMACQKVVKLDLRIPPPQYVIEGDITDQPGPYTVRILQTTAFYDSNSFKGVTGATVQVSDGQGSPEVLVYGGGGNYYTRQLQGTPGRTYTLSVLIGDSSFSATSTMPQHIPLDDIDIEQVQNSGKNVLVAVPVFVNPQGPGIAYYLFDQTINGVLDKTLYYWNSQYSQGLINTLDLERSDPDSTLHSGDSVQIEMRCLDKPVYTYWSSLDAAATGSGGSYPGNPVTNLTGGALGYFSAHTSQTKGIRVE